MDLLSYHLSLARTLVNDNACFTPFFLCLGYVLWFDKFLSPHIICAWRASWIEIFLEITENLLQNMSQKTNIAKYSYLLRHWIFWCSSGGFNRRFEGWCCCHKRSSVSGYIVLLVSPKLFIMSSKNQWKVVRQIL